MIDHANVACGFHAGDPLIMYTSLSDNVILGLVTDMCILGKTPCGHARSITSKSERIPAYLIFKALGEESTVNFRLNTDHCIKKSDNGGRMKMSPEELTAMVRYQIGALKEFVSDHGLVAAKQTDKGRSAGGRRCSSEPRKASRVSSNMLAW